MRRRSRAATVPTLTPRACSCRAAGPCGPERVLPRLAPVRFPCCLLWHLCLPVHVPLLLGAPRLFVRGTSSSVPCTLGLHLPGVGLPYALCEVEERDFPTSDGRWTRSHSS